MAQLSMCVLNVLWFIDYRPVPVMIHIVVLFVYYINMLCLLLLLGDCLFSFRCPWRQWCRCSSLSLSWWSREYMGCKCNLMWLHVTWTSSMQLFSLAKVCPDRFSAGQRPARVRLAIVQLRWSHLDCEQLIDALYFDIISIFSSIPKLIRLLCCYISLISPCLV